MADVTLSYKGSDILELSDSGSATLKTGGKYCEDDIDVEYVKPSGGGGLTLLGSGTFTRIATGTAAMEIPVSVQGTIVEVLVVSQGTPTGVAGSFAWEIYYSQNSIIENTFPIGAIICRTKNSSDSLNYMMPRANGTGATNTEITCLIPNTGNPILEGTYDWYIWGVA